MKAVSGWCCGSQCPTFTDPNVALTMAGRVFADDKVRITFTDEANYVVEAVAASTADSSDKLLVATDACAPQGYTFDQGSLQVYLGQMMHVDTNACGKKLMGSSISSSSSFVDGRPHPLLDSPDTVVYWPTADVIAVNDKVGGVHKMKRVL